MGGDNEEKRPSLPELLCSWINEVKTAQEEDKALNRLFKKQIEAAYWLRTKTTKDVVGMQIVFEDGGQLIIGSKHPVGVKLIEPVRRDNKGTRK